METLATDTRSPIDDTNQLTFTLQSEGQIYGTLEAAMYKDECDPERLVSRPACSHGRQMEEN